MVQVSVSDDSHVWNGNDGTWHLWRIQVGTVMQHLERVTDGYV